MNVEQFKNGILNLSNRELASVANKVAEELPVDYKGVLIRAVRILQVKDKKSGLLKKIELASSKNKRWMNARSRADFFCTLGQIRPKDFRYLLVIMFWKDVIVAAFFDKSNLQSLPGYKPYQHRDSRGMSQVTLERYCFSKFGEKCLFMKTLTYSKLKLLMEGGLA